MKDEIAMERGQGETLRERLRCEGPMTPIQAVKTLLPVAHAWCALADRGLVHRAVTLDDVVLTPSGAGHLQLRRLALGVPLDARGDVWAFAAMLFEVLSGKPPFTRTGLSPMLEPIAFGTWPPMGRLDVHDRTLEDIVYHGLRRDPEGRIPSMRAFGTALALWAVDRRVFEDATGASLQDLWLRPAPGAETRAVGDSAMASSIETEADMSDANARDAARTPRPEPEVVRLPLGVLKRAARRHQPARMAARGLRFKGAAHSAGRSREAWSWVAAAAIATLLAAIAVVSFRRDHGANSEAATAGERAPLPAATAVTSAAPSTPVPPAAPPAIAPTFETGATPPDRYPRDPFRQ